MKKLFSITILLISSFLINYAQTSAQGEKITDSSSGYSFKVPKKWSSKKSDDSYVLTDELEKSSIVIKAHKYDSFEAFKNSEGNFESDGFKQVGETRDFKNGGKFVRLFKQLSDKNLIADTFFLRSNSGGGVLIVSFSTDNETADESYKIAYQIADGLTFSSRQSGQQSLQLTSSFAGKKLSYFYTGNGYTENATIWLCGSGRFFSKNESSSSSALGSGFTSGNDQGTWEIVTSGNNIFLVVKSDKGGVWNLILTPRQSSNEIGINGKRFFVQTQNECN